MSDNNLLKLVKRANDPTIRDHVECALIESLDSAANYLRERFLVDGPCADWHKQEAYAEVIDELNNLADSMAQLRGAANEFAG